MEIEIRRGPRDAADEGAIENGQRLTIIGRKLKRDEEMPLFVVAHHILRYPHNMILSDQREFGDEWIAFSVNGLLTPVCHQEARICLEIAAGLPDEIKLIGLTNESPEVVGKWLNENNQRITYSIYSTQFTDTGVRLGLFIPEYDGVLQRALFAVVDGKIVDAQYIYDQGGPLPDFDRAISLMLGG